MIKRLQLWIRNIFGFSRAETNGFLILLPLILIILFSQPLYQWFADDTPLEFDAAQARIDSLVANWDLNPKEEHEITHFLFDPNKATPTEFDSLGFPNFIINRIINYRSKGGQFRKPDDLLKIYGFDSSFFDTIKPYIRIATNAKIEEPSIKSQKIAEKKSEIKILFDLNKADTTQLKMIRGIGTVLAARIVKYREALGGFVERAQVKEVYGLDSVVVNLLNGNSLIEESFEPVKLNINKATEQELARHPYINYKLARTIVAYRFQHGSFKEIDDLLKIELIDKSMYSRMAPYLTTEP